MPTTETTIDTENGYVASYVTLRKGETVRTGKIAEGVKTDYDADGNLLGIEVIELWDGKDGK